jgi:hypothetical protein
MMIATSRQEVVHTFNKRMKSWKHWERIMSGKQAAIAMAASFFVWARLFLG